jgi:hypothetical protein
VRLSLWPVPSAAADGENVFVMSVDAPTVLTLSPANLFRLLRVLRAMSLEDERDAVRREAETSYTPYDIDVLIPPGAVQTSYAVLTPLGVGAASSARSRDPIL